MLSISAVVPLPYVPLLKFTWYLQIHIIFMLQFVDAPSLQAIIVMDEFSKDEFHSSAKIYSFQDIQCTSSCIITLSQIEKMGEQTPLDIEPTPPDELWSIVSTFATIANVAMSPQLLYEFT